MNPGSNAGKSFQLFVILDVYGQYYFAPTWTSELACVQNTWSAGMTAETILAPFKWPVTGTSLSGVLFLSGQINPVSGTLVGEFDCWEFGWTD